jgi:uncharacterized protein involved in high-affinity Fe2+ transport
MERKTGITIFLVTLAIVGCILYFNLQPREPATVVRPQVVGANESDAGSDSANALQNIENFIDEREQNGMLITAVWLPPIQMEGEELPQHSNVIHLEADIHALAGNRNGFGKGAWIPYLTVKYEIVPVSPTGDSIRGELLPMVAKDGPHYGATIEMPGEGKYRLIYRIDNPSKKEFGRHSDPVTGVEPWWDPFDVTFEMDYQRASPITK